MRYDLNDHFSREQAERRFRLLTERGAVIELTEKKQRTLQANAYLHLIIGWFALQVGESAEYVKRAYYKTHCNPDLFVWRKEDTLLGRETPRLKSSSDLSKTEMSLSIERFRNWAAEEAGIYLPSADEAEFLRQMENDVAKGAQWL